MVWNKRTQGLLVLTIVLVGVSLLLNIYLFIKARSPVVTKPSSKESQVEVPKSLSLPTHNALIYTRCYGDTRQPSNCKLFVSSINQPIEQVAYIFEFPNVTPTPEEIGFSLN